MAFIKRDVKDRVIQYPKRFRFVPVSGQADTYDLVPVTGTVTEPGTPINKAYLQPIEDAISDIESGVTEVGKANKIGDKSADEFVQKLILDDAIIDNAAYLVNYMGDFQASKARGDMPTGWYHVIYVRHQNTNGYGFQLFHHFDQEVIWIRKATGTTWTAPKIVSDPINHASGGTSYGVGNASNYGHVKVVENLTTAAGNGLALGAGQGKALKDLIDSNLKPVAGTYTGNDAETRTISLGFRPKAVILQNNKGMSYVRRSNDDQLWGGIVADGSPLMYNSDVAITIASNGFVVNKDSYAIYLNNSNAIYHYVAFR